MQWTYTTCTQKVVHMDIWYQVVLWCLNLFSDIGKDCLFGNPYWDQKWYCRQKLCTKSRVGRKKQKEPTSPSPKHLCSLAFNITTPPPYQQGKKKKKSEQWSNFKCNSATTPINLNFIPQRRCILQAGKNCVVALLGNPECCVDFTLHNTKLFFSIFVVWCCFRRLFSDAFL